MEELSTERRSEPRVRVHVPFYVKTDAGAGMAHLVDISCSGARIELPVAGTEWVPQVHTLVLDLGAGAPLRLLARTVWRSESGYAVSFLALDEVDRLEIAEQIDSYARLRGAYEQSAAG